ISQNNNLFFFLRILRSIISFLVICIFFSDTYITSKEIFETFVYAALIHSFAVISISFSSTARDFFELFSGYEKKILPMRSSGLFSGYDFAGYFLNIAVFTYGCITLTKIKSSIKNYLILFILAASVLFTSRFNIVILVLNIFVLFYLSLKYGRYKDRFVFFILSVILTLSGILFMIISMNINAELKIILLQKLPFLNILNNDITDSYANYDAFHTIVDQFTLPNGWNTLFGLNSRAPTDPGYINIIYFAGLIGLISILGLYIFMIQTHLKNKNNKAKFIIIYVFVLTLIYELKLSFLFSTGS
ncbi:TPA: hypothetical protein QFP04_002391, partial [Enterococcus faecium]